MIFYAAHGELNMATVRKTVTLTDQQDEWVKAQIARGDFTNDSEYIRDLIRRDQERHTKLDALRDTIQDGLACGVSEKTLGEIWREAEQRSARS
jgi:antitoxin ParD1/3/4